LLLTKATVAQEAHPPSFGVVSLKWKGSPFIKKKLCGEGRGKSSVSGVAAASNKGQVVEHRARFKQDYGVGLRCAAPLPTNYLSLQSLGAPSCGRAVSHLGHPPDRVRVHH
jgi:hypothetical protein